MHEKTQRRRRIQNKQADIFFRRNGLKTWYIPKLVQHKSLILGLPISKNAVVQHSSDFIIPNLSLDHALPYHFEWFECKKN